MDNKETILIVYFQICNIEGKLDIESALAPVADQ